MAPGRPRARRAPCRLCRGEPGWPRPGGAHVLHRVRHQRQADRRPRRGRAHGVQIAWRSPLPGVSPGSCRFAAGPGGRGT